jgi:hypothetical protein
LSWRPTASYEGEAAFLKYRYPFTAFKRANGNLIGDILIPRYYDPKVQMLAPMYSEKCERITLGELVDTDIISMNTGDEVGKLAYGTGDIPFVRTSDFGSWELKREPKQGVSRQIYEQWETIQDPRSGDILLVRDGTYLVGTSVLVHDTDLPLLYCGGLIRIRSVNDERLNSALLLALLNLPVVWRQMRNKQFTRDVIDTLGKRLSEVWIPIPRDATVCRQISETIGSLIGRRHNLRMHLDETVRSMYPAA